MNRLKVPVEGRISFFLAHIPAVAFSRASLGAPWTWDTAKWQLPLALGTCHQSRNDQCFICPSCQGGHFFFFWWSNVKLSSSLKAVNSTAGIKRRHRWQGRRGRGMPLALKISQQQEQSQKLQGPSSPVTLLHVPQKWEGRWWSGFFAGYQRACSWESSEVGWITPP